MTNYHGYLSQRLKSLNQRITLKKGHRYRFNQIVQTKTLLDSSKIISFWEAVYQGYRRKFSDHLFIVDKSLVSLVFEHEKEVPVLV